MVVAVVLVLFAEFVEQFRIGALALFGEIIDGVADALADEVGPHAVDDGFGKVLVLDQ